jgi:hypothetical protein
MVARPSRAWLGLVSVLLVVSTAYADTLSDRFKVAEKLGDGSYKNVYAVEGHPELALGILKPGKRAETLDEEKALLDEYAAAGVPTATVFEVGTYDGRPAYLMKRFATGSKALDWETKRWEVLNETTIEDCRAIEAALKKAKISVWDAQFLVADDGHVVLNDPLALDQLEWGGVTNAKPILLGIEQEAQEAIETRKLLAGMPDAQDPVLETYFARARVALRYGDAHGEAALKEALLHYLESGPTTDEAREVARSIRDGTFDVEFLRPYEFPKKPSAVGVFFDGTFPKLARDLVSGGLKKLHAAASALETDVVAAAHALDFLGKKSVPAPLTRDPNTPREPTELVKALAAENRTRLDDAERARLEGIARGILERGADAPSPSIGINAVIERDVNAADHPVER